MTAARVPFAATRMSARYSNLGRLPVRVVLHDVRSLYNVGAFFRTADAVQLDRLCLSGITGHPPHAAITKTALGAEDHVAWETCAEPVSYLDGLHREGYEVAAIETSATAVDLFDWRPSFPVTLCFGYEVDGLDSELLERCDQHVRLPMRGIKHSLNVATAGGVVLFELLRRYRDL